MSVDIWMCREELVDADLADFHVEATDGEIGKIDAASFEAGAGSIIVDTGPWILGKKVFLPAGTIERIDWDEQKVYIDRTKDEIKDAPEYDPSGYADQEYRKRLEDYYLRFYP